MIGKSQMNIKTIDLGKVDLTACATAEDARPVLMALEGLADLPADRKAAIVDTLLAQAYPGEVEAPEGVIATEMSEEAVERFRETGSPLEACPADYTALHSLTEALLATADAIRDIGEGLRSAAFMMDKRATKEAEAGKDALELDASRAASVHEVINHSSRTLSAICQGAHLLSQMSAFKAIEKYEAAQEATTATKH
jgi:hypothetical protein